MISFNGSGEFGRKVIFVHHHKVRNQFQFPVQYRIDKEHAGGRPRLLRKRPPDRRT